MRNVYISCTLFVLVAFSVLGCSGRHSNPAIPDTSPTSMPGLLTSSSQADQKGAHALLGIWTLYFNQDDLSVEISPSRELQQHYNITLMLTPPHCTDCVKLEVQDWDPLTKILKVKVSIKNPTKLEPYDVRGILYTDDFGRMLVNADNWTGYWDIPGGEEINPFFAWAKHTTKHKFFAEATMSEVLHIYMPSWQPVYFAVDASFPGNCGEPYRMDMFEQHSLDPLGEWQVYVDIYNWFGEISPVYLDLPDVCGSVELNYTGETTNEGAQVFGGVFNNTMGASPGIHKGVLRAYSDDPEPLYEPVNFYLSEYDPSQEGWALSWKDEYEEEKQDLAYITEAVVDQNDDIIVVGTSSTMFPNMPTVKKISPDGEEIWRVAMEWPFIQWENGSQGHGVAVDSVGDIYATGFFSETLDFMPGSGEDLHEALGRQDAYLVKYSSTGDYLWGHNWGGELVGGEAFIDRGYAVDVDNSGGVYVTGTFWGTCDFDPGPGVEERVSNGNEYGGYDCYLTKFDSSGNFQWVNTWGSDNASMQYDYFARADIAYGLKVDPNDDVYVTGGFSDTVDFDPGPGVVEHTANGTSGDVFLIKFNSDGGLIWVNVWEGYGGCGIDEYTNPMYLIRLRSGGKYIALDTGNNVYVTGFYRDSVDFDPGSGIDIHSGAGPFISKFEPDGSYIGAITWDAGPGNYMFSDGLALSNTNETYLTGCYMGTLDFDPGPGEDLHTNDPWTDAFLIKLDSGGNFLWSRTLEGLDDYMWNGSQGKGVVTDSQDYVYMTGCFDGVTDLNPMPLGYDIHYSGWSFSSALLKYKPDGCW